jgi:hypothetical protein
MSKRLGGAGARHRDDHAWQRPWRRAPKHLRVAEALIQRHWVETKRWRILSVSKQPRALEYPRDFLSREPETLAWIDAFRTPCLDFGANVGSYALSMRGQSRT